MHDTWLHTEAKKILHGRVSFLKIYPKNQQNVRATYQQSHARVSGYVKFIQRILQMLELYTSNNTPASWAMWIHIGRHTTKHMGVYRFLTQVEFLKDCLASFKWCPNQDLERRSRRLERSSLPSCIDSISHPCIKGVGLHHPRRHLRILSVWFMGDWRGIIKFKGCED